MAPILGKRKRRAAVDNQQPPAQLSDESDHEGIQAIFKRAFEAKFAPLEVKRTAVATRKDEDGSDEDQYSSNQTDEEDLESDAEGSDWTGFSSTSSTPPQIEIVEVVQPSRPPDKASQDAARKAFMSSKPPSSTTTIQAPSSSSRSTTTTSDDAHEAANLKNDLALQRLLRESHLLSASTGPSSNTTSLALSGRDRHKATDLRLQSLGSRSSVFSAGGDKGMKMPLAHRRGIIAKAQEKEEKRRSEARENGIVLERAVGKKGRGGGSGTGNGTGNGRALGGGMVARKRERGVGAPSIGRFKGGTLELSKRDIRSVERAGASGKEGFGRKKGKKGRRM